MAQEHKRAKNLTTLSLLTFLWPVNTYSKVKTQETVSGHIIWPLKNRPTFLPKNTRALGKEIKIDSWCVWICRKSMTHMNEKLKWLWKIRRLSKTLICSGYFCVIFIVYYHLIKCSGWKDWKLHTKLNILRAWSVSSLWPLSLLLISVEKFM